MHVWPLLYITVQSLNSRASPQILLYPPPQGEPSVESIPFRILLRTLTKESGIPPLPNLSLV